MTKLTAHDTSDTCLSHLHQRTRQAFLCEYFLSSSWVGWLIALTTEVASGGGGGKCGSG